MSKSMDKDSAKLSKILSQIIASSGSSMKAAAHADDAESCKRSLTNGGANLDKLLQKFEPLAYKVLGAKRQPGESRWEFYCRTTTLTEDDLLSLMGPTLEMRRVVQHTTNSTQ
jgi:hypothetical protein